MATEGTTEGTKEERLFLAEYRRVIDKNLSINLLAMDVLISEISNSLSTTADDNLTTTNLTATLFNDVFSCSPLNRVDLVNVFAKLDVALNFGAAPA